MIKRYSLRCLLLTLVASFILSSITLAEQREALRVCADPNSLPFSHKNGEGFENRIADILAADLGIPVEYTFFPQRRGFIRSTLRAEHPTRPGYKCDLVMGVPAGFELAITTKPYYRSTYALVYVKGRNLDAVATPQDLINLDPELRDQLRIGIFEQTPAALWLARNGMTLQMVAYPTMAGDPDEYPGILIEEELVQNKLDAVILWGPIGGYFAKRITAVDIAVIPLQSEAGIRFDFAISMAVRFGEGEWKNQLEALIDRNADKIDAVFQEYNTPLLDLSAAATVVDKD